MVIAYTPENVRLQNVTEIKGGHVTCCLISNTMDQILRSHENAIRPALTTQKLDRCNCSFNKCLIHVSQARYRLTLHPKKKKKTHIVKLSTCLGEDAQENLQMTSRSEISHPYHYHMTL